MSKITKSARGEECQVRIPGVCNHNPETTVFAHIGGGGMGMKQPDCEGAYCCSACHDVVDGRVPFEMANSTAFGREISRGFNKAYLYLAHFEGCVRTRKILIEKGLIILK